MGINGSALAANETAAELLPAQLLEAIVGGGDLGKLSAAQQTEYLVALCRSMGLNPLSRPIRFMSLNGKTVPYALKDCTEQLRKIHRVSIEIVSREVTTGIYTVTARATLPDGRADEDVGSVVVDGLKGDNLANATMKAHTKAKRRVTLSICGLGILDESELDTVAESRRRPVQQVPAPALEPHVEMDAEYSEAAEVPGIDWAALSDDQWIALFNDAETKEAVNLLRDKGKANLPLDKLAQNSPIHAASVKAQARTRKGGAQ